MASETQSRSRPPEGRIRNPSLVGNLLKEGLPPPHQVVLLLGAVRFQWGAPEAELPPIGSDLSFVPPAVAQDLPPGWVVTEAGREQADDGSRTVIRAARSPAAAGRTL